MGTVLVLSVVLGAVVASASVAAQAADNVGIESAVEADGNVELVTNKSVGLTDVVVELDGETIYDGDDFGDDSGDPSITGAAPEELHDVEVTSSSGNRRHLVSLQDSSGDRIDVAPNRDLDVTLSYSTPDGGTESVSTGVTVTSAVVSESDGNDDRGDGRHLYQGAPVAIEADDVDSAVFLSNEETGAVVLDGSTGAYSNVLTVDTSEEATGVPYRIYFDDQRDDAHTEWFRLWDLDWSVSATETAIDDETDVEVEVSANRRGEPLVAELTNGAGDIVATRSQTLDADGTSTLSFDTANSSDINAEDGPYTVTVTDNGTNTSAATEDITVSEAVEPSATLNETVYREVRGDVARIGVELQNTDTATVVVGTAGRTNYVTNVTVEDGNDDGYVTLEFNTYTAGAGENVGPDGDAYTVHDVVAEEDSIVRIGRGSGDFTTVDHPQEATLEATGYRVSARAGTSARADPDTVAVLTLEERSTTSVSTYVAPKGHESAIESAADIRTLVSNGTVTETTEIANGDVLLTKVNTSGVEGLLRNGTNVRASNRTAAFYDENHATDGSGSKALSYAITQTNPGLNAEGYSVGLDATNSRLYYDARNESMWLVHDTGRLPELAAGDELVTNFTARAEDGLIAERTSVRDNWTVVGLVGGTTLDRTADRDDDDVDELTLQRAPNQSISGSTNLAPGTELTIQVSGTDDESPFFRQPTAVVEPNGAFHTTVDVGKQPVGANFTVQVYRDGTALLAAPVDGRVVDAPTAAVTFDDQTSAGSTVTISSVRLPEAGAVAIHLENASGTVVGTSQLLEAGNHSAVTVSLNRTLDGDSNLVAIPHRVADGDDTERLAAAYLENGSAVTDVASVSITSSPQTTTAVGTESPPDEGTPVTATPVGSPPEATPAADETATETPTTTAANGAGFGLLVAIASMLGVALLVLARRDGIGRSRD